MPGLLNLLKFFAASEEHLLPKFNIFIVAIEVYHLYNYTYSTVLFLYILQLAYSLVFGSFPIILAFTSHLQVVKIFNLFITYGDTFLPSPTTYDELYYELIRMQKVFEDAHAMGNIEFPFSMILYVYTCRYTIIYTCSCIYDCMFDFSYIWLRCTHMQPSATAVQTHTASTTPVPASWPATWSTYAPSPHTFTPRSTPGRPPITSPPSLQNKYVHVPGLQ